MTKISTLIFLSVLFSFNTLFAAPTPEGNAAIEQRILQDVNAYRAKHGLNTLQMNAFISQQARQHSLDMANHRMKFGHKAFSKRIKTIYSTIPYCRAGAENVAYNYKPNVMVANWLTSPGHKRNIDGHYNLTGVGVARDQAGKLYYTQIFIRADVPTVKNAQSKRWKN